VEHSIDLAVQRMVDIALALQEENYGLVLQKNSHSQTITHQLQLLKLHQCLFHARLVHLNLLILLKKGQFMVF
jgi:hypothetical protein